MTADGDVAEHGHALCAIAVGNMFPDYVDEGDGRSPPLPAICVDPTAFVLGKRRDRGTHQAFGVVTNPQDVMHGLRSHVEPWEQR